MIFISAIVEVIVSIFVISTVLRVIKQVTSNGKESFDKVLNRTANFSGNKIAERKINDAVDEEFEIALEEAKQSAKDLYKAGIISREEYIEYKNEREEQTW